MELNPEFEALIDAHRTGEYKGRPVVDAVGGEIAILGTAGDEVVYKHVGIRVGDGPDYGKMDASTLACFVGKSVVGELETCEVSA